MEILLTLPPSVLTVRGVGQSDGTRDKRVFLLVFIGLKSSDGSLKIQIKYIYSPKADFRAVL